MSIGNIVYEGSGIGDFKVVCVSVSLLDRSSRATMDRAGYAEQSRRMRGGAALAAAE